MVEPSISRPSDPPGEPILLVVGVASRDLDADDPRGWRLGGTVSYASLAAARMGIRIRSLIGVDEQAATAHEIDTLRAAGIEVLLAPLARGPVFDNTNTPAGRVQLVHQVSDLMPSDVLPEAWRATPHVLVGPVAGELGADWASAIAAESFVALAWQGLLRRLTPGAPVERLPLARLPLVERADALALSAEDAVAGGPPLGQLLRDGQLLLVTDGRHGAVQISVSDEGARGRYVPALPEREPIDTTGAGDVFLATWLASRALLRDRAAAGDDSWRPLAVASAVASLSVEARTLADLPARERICALLLRLRERQLG